MPQGAAGELWTTLLQASVQSCRDPFAEVTQSKIRVMDPANRSVQPLVPRRAVKRRHIVGFVAESEDTRVLFR